MEIKNLNEIILVAKWYSNWYT